MRAPSRSRAFAPPACAPPIPKSFESAFVSFAQSLAIEEPFAVPSDRFLHRVAECLRASHPTLPEREFARCVLIARRACVREILEGD
jgi:hypothetical protein